MGINDERLLTNLLKYTSNYILTFNRYYSNVFYDKKTINECISYFEQRHSNTTELINNIVQKNLEETIRHELESMISCCQQAIHRLETKPITVSKHHYHQSFNTNNYSKTFNNINNTFSQFI